MPFVTFGRLASHYCRPSALEATFLQCGFRFRVLIIPKVKKKY
jgi:hypothetical protein